MLTIVVSGALANKPHNGGHAHWLLSYLLGLRRLGCRVYFIEQIAAGRCTPDALAYFDAVLGGASLAEAVWLLQEDGEIVRGGSRNELLSVVEHSDLLLNVSGNLTSEPLFSRFGRRAYIDEDPGFTQLWLDAGHSVGRLSEHAVHFTVGLNIGTPRCSLPTAGIQWRPTVPPVVLAEWPAISAREPDRFTTIASWRSSYGRVEHHGVLYGQKAHEFRKLVELPRRVETTLELALAIDPADERDRRLLLAKGWQLVDPHAVAGTPDDFRRYVQGSAAEFSPAQGIYAETSSGWFSERTARYLASGRPAVVQDTGFGETVPAGEGLLTFQTIDEAVSTIDDVLTDYESHARAARGLAERYFDSDRVLTRLLEQALP